MKDCCPLVDVSCNNNLIEQNGKHAISFQTYFINSYLCCSEGLQYWV